MHQTLEIRHQISIDVATGDYVLREVFGNQPQKEWRFASLDDAKAAHARRQSQLKELVANISPEARKAVEDARHIDNLKAGNA